MFIIYAILLSILSLIFSIPAIILQFKENRLQIQAFPELTGRYASHKRKMIRYESSHMKKAFNTTYLMYFGLFFLILGAIFAMTNLNRWLLISLDLGIVIIGISRLLPPTLKEEDIFWRKYLTENPDNQMKVTLLPEEDSRTLARYTAVLSWFLVVIGALLIFQGIINH